MGLRRDIESTTIIKFIVLKSVDNNNIVNYIILLSREYCTYR